MVFRFDSYDKTFPLLQISFRFVTSLFVFIFGSETTPVLKFPPDI